MKKRPDTVVMLPVDPQPYTKTEWFCIPCGAKGLWAQGTKGAHTGLYGCAKCGEIFAMDNWVQDDNFDPRALERALAK